MKLALTLAGGGSLGAYEVGACKALKELGFKFDIVTGTSIGAINGAFVVNDSIEEAIKLWRQITADGVMTNGMNFSYDLFNTSIIKKSITETAKWLSSYVKNSFSADITPFKNLVGRSVDAKSVKESKIKFGIVCCEFPSLKGVDVYVNMLDEKKIVPFLHASSACAPIFPIEKIDNQSYVDGFYYDNLPIRLALEYGADKIIAIDLRLFSLKPNNAFYLKLPTVSYIAPYPSLGSLMNFSIETIDKHIKMGYNDVMKYYGKLLGFYFSFKGKINSSGYVKSLNQFFGPDMDEVVSLLTKDIRKPMTEDDYYIRSLELLAMNLKIDTYAETYTEDEFKQLIIDKIIEVYKLKTTKSLTQQKINDFFDGTLRNAIKSISIKNKLFKYLIDNYFVKNDCLSIALERLPLIEE